MKQLRMGKRGGGIPTRGPGGVISSPSGVWDKALDKFDL